MDQPSHVLSGRFVVTCEICEEEGPKEKKEYKYLSTALKSVNSPSVYPIIFGRLKFSQIDISYGFCNIQNCVLMSSLHLDLCLKMAF
jgi:hypothetical protein